MVSAAPVDSTLTTEAGVNNSVKRVLYITESSLNLWILIPILPLYLASAAETIGSILMLRGSI